jgi:23S rRNA pseudouridine955/2504/2580 synthase
MQANQGIMENSPVRWLTVEDDRAGQRIDNYLKNLLKGVPKTRIYQMIRKGEVRVNKGRIKPDYKLSAGDIVRVPPVKQATKAPMIDYRFIPILEHIVFENTDMLVLNKPPGLAVHGGSGLQGGVIESLRAHKPDAHYLELAHRLDRDTSGLLVIAKKRAFLRRFQAELRSKHHLEKHYDLLVHGDWPDHITRVEAPIEKFTFASGDRVSKVTDSGKPCQTIFSVKQRFGQVTWLTARLVTGRMHQIRVHAAWVGCPILGDAKYGSTAQDQHLSPMRMMLHASKLKYQGAGQVSEGQLKSFSLAAPIEPAMKAFITTLQR